MVNRQSVSLFRDNHGYAIFEISSSAQIVQLVGEIGNVFITGIVWVVLWIKSVSREPIHIPYVIKIIGRTLVFRYRTIVLAQIPAQLTLVHHCKEP